MKLPKYKYLLTYRYAEIISDLTVVFCKRFLSGYDFRRSRDQMIQAARSGKQNIIEAIGLSRTTTKGEVKLLGVSLGSFEELLADYEDFLRQRSLSIWSKTDSRVSHFRKYAYRLTNLSNLSHSGHLKERPLLPEKPEQAANLMLTLCHQTTYLLTKQIESCEKRFVKEGGYTEKMFRKRLAYRSYQQ